MWILCMYIYVYINRHDEITHNQGHFHLHPKTWSLQNKKKKTSLLFVQKKNKPPNGGAYGPISFLAPRLECSHLPIASHVEGCCPGQSKSLHVPMWNCHLATSWAAEKRGQLTPQPPLAGKTSLESAKKNVVFWSSWTYKMGPPNYYKWIYL